ncbi:hypothetical protein LDJ86_12000 (plasmid) [Fusobacterium polymorphum ATCC 10953]|uniref:hypothetical protein n=1 Tax=Fusobacterium nucleatum subsp. polymorphum TaxID=76857 RepID=UPI00324732FB
MKKLLKMQNYIADLCNVEIGFGNLQFPYYEVPSEYSGMDEYLKTICHTNIKKLYKEDLTKDILDRLEYELSVIIKNGIFWIFYSGLGFYILCKKERYTCWTW